MRDTIESKMGDKMSNTPWKSDQWLTSQWNFAPEVTKEINFPEKIIKPAIIKPVRVSIIGVALIKTLPIFIFFSTKSFI